MRRNAFDRFLTTLLLISILFTSSASALAQSGVKPSADWLVAVFAPNLEDLTRFDGLARLLAWPVYQHVQGGKREYVLTAMPESDLDALGKVGLDYRVLDRQIDGAAYYLVSARPAALQPHWESFGTVLLDDGIQVLMRLPAAALARLAESGAELAAITLDSKPLNLTRPVYAPQDINVDPLIQIMIDQVIASQVYSYTGDISGEWPVSIGGTPYTILTRNTNSVVPIQKATQFVGEHLSSLGLDVEYHQWSDVTYPNVIAEIPGLTDPENIYILGAHLDNMPSSGRAPGADDNASGVVAALLAADIFSQYQWGCTLRFAFWTGEEQGLNGSAAYAQRVYNRGENILGNLNLDMIAWNSSGSVPGVDLHARSTVPGSLEMAQLFADVIAAYDLNLIPDIHTNGSSASDHASFWTYNYPAILAIEDFDDFNPYYHTINDDMDNFPDWPYYLDFVKASLSTFAHLSGCLIPQADFTLQAQPATQGICLPGDASYELGVGEILDFPDPVTLSVVGTPTGTSSDFSVNPVMPDDPPVTSTLTINASGAASPGRYPLDVIGIAPTSTHTTTVTLNLFNDLPAQITLVAPLNQAMNVSPRPTFTWQAVAQAQNYLLEIATDSSFSQLIASVSLADTTYTPSSDLPTGTRLYWRVTADNACGQGTVSATWRFRTQAAPGDCAPGTLPNVLMSEDFENGAIDWSSAGTGNTWALSTARPNGGSYAYYAQNVSSVSDQQLTSPSVSLPSGSGQELSLQYWDWQQIEDMSGDGCYDGGLLEISTDDGLSWTQLNSQLQTFPYHGLISSSFSNPLAGRKAWCKDDNPSWSKSIVDLDGYSGETISFRYRLGTDSSAGREGWYLDDLRVQSCIPAATSFDFWPDSIETGGPRQSVTHRFSLDNLGPSDSYTLTVSGAAWPSLLQTVSPLAVVAGGMAEVEVNVNILNQLGSDFFTITAQSVSSPSLILTATGTTNSIALQGLMLSPLSSSQVGAPGQVITYTYTLTNTGQYADSFELAVSALWPTTLSAVNTAEVPAGGRATFFLTVMIPNTEVEGQSDHASLTVTSELDDHINAQVDAQTVVRWPYHLYLPLQRR